MDRETLSHYGWIVILVLILMCLLFFATPFGSFVANGVKVTLDGYYAVNDKVEYSDAIVHAFRKFRAPFSGKAVHTFPEQSAVI